MNRSYWLRRYAAARTDTEAIIAALNPGGVMQSSGLCFVIPSRDETGYINIGSTREMSSPWGDPPFEYRFRRYTGWSSIRQPWALVFLGNPRVEKQIQWINQSQSIMRQGEL